MREMTREIKFRDYDMDNKKLRYFNLDTYDRQEHDAWGNVMEYTGKMDKNNVEIYYGDIYKVTNDNHYWKFIVKDIPGFGNNLYGVLIEDNLSTNEEEDKYTYEVRKFENGRWEHISSKAVVIGNIHQNPELI